MDENNNNQQKNNEPFFNSLSKLRSSIKDGTYTEILDDWKWIFTYSRRSKGAIVFYTLVGIFSSSMGLVSSVASKYVIDIVTGYKTEKLGMMIAITVGSAAFSLVFSSLIKRLTAKLSIDINNDVQADIFDQIVDADWKAINEYTSGDVLHRFNSDVSTVSGNAISWLPSIIIALYNFVATFFVIWHYSKVMSLLAFAGAPVMLLMSKYLITKQREYARKMKEVGSQMTGFEVEAFYNMDTIKSFGIMKLYGKKLRKWQKKLREITLKHNMFTIKTNIFMSVLGLIIQYSAFGYCLYLLWTHQITYGTMTLFLTQRGRLASAFNSLVGIIPAFLTSSVSAHRIRELIDLPRERHLPESEELRGLVDDGFEVRMNGVNFSYKEGKRVITDSAFKAKPGEIVALVGPSGEGKTTMIRLMLGLVRPDEGAAFLRASDGTEVEMNADSRFLFSYVPQGNTILSGTVAENMRMVKEEATDEEIIEALKIACAWDFISKMPDSINSKIGERGRGFSEGQAQRIAIARAVLRDAPILLLDEATSALDVTTERKVLKNIIQQKPNKTCIVTTHRPTVLNICKRVYRVMQTHVTELNEEDAGRMAMDF